MTRRNERKVIVNLIEKDEVFNLRLLGRCVAEKFNSRRNEE